ncbi:MAG: NAD(P)(+) transhydrogenase (Re/Si-specific) subunit beta [Gammaproteobacteria bacterium]|nr:NAD(P)(+) transhydrogenase (Re/Si-specific) subunit beta [Gammaproteobacteria bacterium]NIR98218.1 NAD(P)(+) transhydrogenase (Re/Si-specific) subunit beta [Gammaproteobacteria bacterium]NIT63889.1 NAD(P)(+) transhydrogenase (Re/Si-specific) subunit beta [Gammaproteobacteria bacterium]NIV20893.1 NAD(P)(+) transhydrogenase (Re/Si-specific) subunit beta [Gammaproteobacteria bacterium]NIY32469.1 NAD(P)(+) transhydrogenase (Re/Si-specific) subunit beta [Gammaproteobacteria bacterium]
MHSLIQVIYFVAAVLFIVGLKRMSSPKTARDGIVWAGAGMLAATLVTFFTPGLSNFDLMIYAIAIGTAIAWISGKRVAMTNMPQMIALYNGMGGGAAGAIAAVELIKGVEHDLTTLALAVLGALIGTVSFSGSLVAFAKLQGWMKGTLRFSLQQKVNLAVFAGAMAVGLLIAFTDVPPAWTIPFFALALAFGVLMTLPIGGADMPVVISLYNALTGLAVGFEGFVLDNAAMIIAGTVVGAAGTLLTQLMAKAMNRSLANVLFGSFGAGAAAEGGETEGVLKPIDADDVAVMMAFANKVIIVPGYGMAVAQAQHKIWELAKALIDGDVKVRFAIHPVAGRMPGHMNVLLAEADVPYDLIADLEDINPEFESTDVALVIGANDVVNPMARTNPDSPIYGMPILDVDKAKNVVVIKRGKGKGFSGIENALFYADNTRMLYGDGQEMAAKLVQGVKAL